MPRRAGADWLLLGPGVELRKTHYDMVATAERVPPHGLSDVEDFAVRYILHPSVRARTVHGVGTAEVTGNVRLRPGPPR